MLGSIMVPGGHHLEPIMEEAIHKDWWQIHPNPLSTKHAYNSVVGLEINVGGWKHCKRSRSQPYSTLHVIAPKSQGILIGVTLRCPRDPQGHTIHAQILKTMISCKHYTIALHDVIHFIDRNLGWNLFGNRYL
jgi:hypothetical protein